MYGVAAPNSASASGRTAAHDLPLPASFHALNQIEYDPKKATVSRRRVSVAVRLIARTVEFDRQSGGKLRGDTAPANMLTTSEVHEAAQYSDRRDAEIARFENNETVHDLPAIFHYWSNKYLLPKIRPFGFVHPDDFFVKQLAATMLGTPSQWHSFVSIGAGNCDTEVRVASALKELGHTNFSIECIDLNRAMLHRGAQQAKAAGCSRHIVAIEGDFNDWTPIKPFHAVIANQSLHHVVNLEGLFDSIAAAIRPTNGVLVTSDMIGRNGHQRWPEALEIVEEFWRQLPERSKYNWQLRRTDAEFVNWDCATEGFEGIRAQDILPLLLSRFHFDLFVPFANVISPFIDRCFGPNFDVNSQIDIQLIDSIHARDELEMAAGRIKPTQMFAVLSLDHSRESVHLPGLPPAACVRPC